MKTQSITGHLKQSVSQIVILHWLNIAVGVLITRMIWLAASVSCEITARQHLMIAVFANARVLASTSKLSLITVCVLSIWIPCILKYLDKQNFACLDSQILTIPNEDTLTPSLFISFCQLSWTLLTYSSLSTWYTFSHCFFFNFYRSSSTHTQLCTMITHLQFDVLDSLSKILPLKVILQTFKCV